MEDFTFTVLTPTYNRLHTIGDVFRSLQAQTDIGFEWLVVDDGSTDGTRESVERWAHESHFPVRYLWQPNGGKHVAVNRGVREARGEMLVILDSDDRCVPRAIERFRAAWAAIPDAEKASFSGVCCHCEDEAGQRIGSGFGGALVDADPHWLARQGRLRGEKWGFTRTDVMRAHPYPEYPNEKSVPDSIVWDRINARYRLLFVDEALRVYRHSPDGWIAQLSVRAARSPNAHVDYYAQRLRYPLSLANRFKSIVNQVRFCLRARRRLRVGGPWWPANVVILVPALVIGVALWVRDSHALRMVMPML